MNFPTNIQLNFVAMQQMAAGRQSDKVLSNMEMCIKHRCGTESLWKNGIHWHSSMLAGCLWRSKSEAVGAEFWQWRQWCGKQAKFWMAMHRCYTVKWRASQWAHPYHFQHWLCWKKYFAAQNFSVILLFVVISMEINQRHYFQSDLAIYLSICIYMYIIES